MNSRKKSMLLRYADENKSTILLLLIIMSVFSCATLIWHYDIRAVLYADLVSIVLCAALFTMGYFSFRTRITHLHSIIGDFDTALERLPEPKCETELEWYSIAVGCLKKIKSLSYDAETKLAEAEDYYAAWAHQIKVPISALKLITADVDEKTRREADVELTRIERYCDMIMAYVRLEKSGSDYVFHRVPIDDIIKRVLKKYTNIFIRKKISLDYTDSDKIVLTDEKQLSFVLEQLLSNALKYIPSGGKITISMDDVGCLTVSDTGCGICPEDLPRIFEKGFTGINGHMDNRDARSSGIGLYLTKRICDNLSCGITVISTPGAGTSFTIDLSKPERRMND